MQFLIDHNRDIDEIEPDSLRKEYESMIDEETTEEGMFIFCKKLLFGESDIARCVALDIFCYNEIRNRWPVNEDLHTFSDVLIQEARKQLNGPPLVGLLYIFVLAEESGGGQDKSLIVYSNTTEREYTISDSILQDEELPARVNLPDYLGFIKPLSSITLTGRRAWTAGLYPEKGRTHPAGHAAGIGELKFIQSPGFVGTVQICPEISL